MNHIVVPSGQLRVIPMSQLQQQGQTYAIVSSANNVTPGMNRVMIARPQAASQLFLTRNINGVVTRALQVIFYNFLSNCNNKFCSFHFFGIEFVLVCELKVQ
jgi:CHAT domain-containing protein